MYGGTRYRAISKFALVVLRERNPQRQSCDGWKEVGGWAGQHAGAGERYGEGECVAVPRDQPAFTDAISPPVFQPPQVAWNGEKLDVLRARFQSAQRKAAARKAAASPPPPASA